MPEYRWRRRAVVRALTSHQCGSGSIPGLGVMRELILLLVLILAPKGFPSGTPVFTSSKNKISEFQFPLDYFQAFYHAPLAPEIAQAIPFSSTLNKLLYFTAHSRTSTTSSLSLEFSPFDSTSLKLVRTASHRSSLALCTVSN